MTPISTASTLSRILRLLDDWTLWALNPQPPLAYRTQTVTRFEVAATR